jgi:hypothetical protein
MNRTLACDFHKFGALFGSERASQLNVELDPIDLSLFRLALLAVSRVDPRVSKRNSDILQRPTSFP